MIIMGFALKYGYSILCVVAVALLPAISHSQDYTCSRATYFGSPDCLGTPSKYKCVCVEISYLFRVHNYIVYLVMQM